ncbi:MAG: hypothetical protein JWM34_2307 [Ilumatobacteraceae bacterium]|nr:hypothetical protein [Ilumatobacteraceae bacterium]
MLDTVGTVVGAAVAATVDGGTVVVGRVVTAAVVAGCRVVEGATVVAVVVAVGVSSGLAGSSPRRSLKISAASPPTTTNRTAMSTSATRGKRLPGSGGRVSRVMTGTCAVIGAGRFGPLGVPHTRQKFWSVNATVPHFAHVHVLAALLTSAVLPVSLVGLRAAPAARRSGNTDSAVD